MSVKVTQTASIREELGEMNQQVGRRAYELSRMTGSPRSTPHEDWVNAHKEMIWEPAVEVSQTDDQFVIVAAVAGVEPSDLELRITPQALLIQGQGHEACAGEGVVHSCDFSRGRLFRQIQFPEAIDSGNAVAEYRNGLLRVSVPVMKLVSSEPVANIAAPVEVEEVAEVAAKPAARKTKASKPAATRAKRTK